MCDKPNITRTPHLPSSLPSKSCICPRRSGFGQIQDFSGRDVGQMLRTCVILGKYSSELTVAKLLMACCKLAASRTNALVFNMHGMP